MDFFQYKLCAHFYELKFLLVQLDILIRSLVDILILYFIFIYHTYYIYYLLFIIHTIFIIHMLLYHTCYYPFYCNVQLYRYINYNIIRYID